MTILVGRFPLHAFITALNEYKSCETFQKIMLYTKSMLEQKLFQLGDEQTYNQSLGIDDHILKQFCLKARPQWYENNLNFLYQNVWLGQILLKVRKWNFEDRG